MNSWSCAGHPGHIELPLHVYNVTFFDQLYRLLRAQCVYCHRFQMSRVQINAYVCKLRLLQYGLLDECGAIDGFGPKKGGKNKSAKDGEESSEEEDDEEDVIEKRNTYVKKRTREAQASGRLKAMMAGAKNPMAAEQRRTVIKEFFKDLVSFKKCANCSGYVDKNLLVLSGLESLLTPRKVSRQDTAETDSRKSFERPCLKNLDLR